MINKKYGISQRQIGIYGFKLCLEVYEKYGRKCVVCGAEERLAIHHIDGKGSNYIKQGLEPNNSLDNLQLLCLPCHCSLHSKIMWAKKGRVGGGFWLKMPQKEYNKRYMQKYFKEYRESHREKINELAKNYYRKRKAQDPNYRANRSEYMKEYARKNKERLKEYRRLKAEQKKKLNS